MALLIPPAVFKQLAAMPRADARRILDRLARVAETPGDRHPNVVALSGATGSYRLRQGDWRAVFSIEDGDVILDRVGHRREVYR
jgi:mRNA interferase RelE/StbE